MPSEAGARILVVEDENIIAKDIGQRLESLGYRIAGTVDNGADAMAAAAAGSPDLVLMDLVLRGGMDGVETARSIRRRFDLPVIFLTAFGDRDTLERARVTGPHGYILKPFEDRELQVTIEVALHRHLADKALAESEERFRMLAESSFEGILLCRDGIVVDANTRLAGLLGRESGSLVGKRLFDIIAPAFHDGIRKRMLSGDDSAFELGLLREDLTELPVEAVARSVRHRIQGTMVMVVRDLTMQKEAERAMRHRATCELYGLVVSALPLITPGAHQQVREDLIQIFADRFDAFFRPKFVQAAGASSGGRPLMELYLAWAGELFSNFGMDAESRMRDGRGVLELRCCPWTDFSIKNPVFCMLCRSMAARGFAWVAPGGSVGLKGTIAAGRDRCRLELWPPTGNGQT